MNLDGNARWMTAVLVVSWSAAASAPDAGHTDVEQSVASSFLNAFLEGKFTQAHALLGTASRAALPPGKLQEVWDGTLGKLGALKNREAAPPQLQAGNVVFVSTLEFEKGAWSALVAVGVATQKVEGFFLKPAPSPAGPPASYVDASRFTINALTVGRAPFELGATLTLPRGAGPFPAVVLVHGSGPSDRDESVGGYRVFRDLGEGLASRGIAVLRYDKRTFTHGAKMADVTLETETIDDAVAAVKLLQTRNDIDPSRVFVVGHSQGAFLSPEIARRSGAAGAVLLAPPFRKPWDIIVQQFRYLDVPAAQRTEMEAQMKRLKSGKATGVILGAPVSFWMELAHRDEVAEARKLNRPILVLWGTRDYQVIAEDIAGWRKGLKGVKNAAVVEIPGGNHHFVFGTAASKPTEYQAVDHLMVDVIDRVSGFVVPAPPK